MKRFLIGFIVSFTIGFMAAWIAVVRYPYDILEREDMIWYAKSELVRRCDVGNLVIFGESRGMLGINPVRLGSGVSNLAIGGAGPMEAYYLALRMLDCPNPPKAVLLTFAGAPTYSETPSYGVVAKVFARYSIMGFSDLEEWRRAMRRYRNPLMGKKHFFDLDTRLHHLGYAYRFPGLYFSSLTRGKIAYRGESNQTTFNNIYKRHGTFPKGWDNYESTQGSKGLALSATLGHMHPDSLGQFYMDKLVELLHQHHIPMYYITIPVNQESAVGMNPVFRAEYGAYLEHYKRLYPEFHILVPDFIAMPYYDFRDPDHHNYKGALKWTERLRQIINDAHVEGGPYERALD